MALTEFEIIQRYFSDIIFPSTSAGTVSLGVGDDSAILHIPDTHDLVFSIDTQLAGVHFPAEANAEHIAQRAFRCAISDLAAMGANPLCFTLALTLPVADEAWIRAFSLGLKNAACEFSCSLVGGDTTKGPLSITLQMHGTVPHGQALKRSKAKVGDMILVSGYLGNSAAYVQLMHEHKLGNKEFAHAEELFTQDYFYPQPRITLGKALLNAFNSSYAHSAIDISDGLLNDLGHICRASHTGANIRIDKLPLMPELTACFGKERALQLALSGGDDYQLCFTAPEAKCRKIASICEDMECPVTIIGHITDPADNMQQPVTCYHPDGTVFDFSSFSTRGYTHF
jgi:thiamine-monophosphate kinase